MILEHLPGLQVDAFLITHGHYRTPIFLFLHIPFRRTTIFSIGVSRLGLTGRARRCTVPSFCLEVTSTTRPSRWFCLLHLVRPKGWLTRGRPLVADNTAISENDDGRREGDYSRSVR